MCGCANGGGSGSGAGWKASGTSFRHLQNGAEQVPNEECPYTVELLRQWDQKLTTAKNQQQFDLLGVTPFQINSYLGYVKSALNYPAVLCFYKDHLNVITQVIESIDAL